MAHYSSGEFVSRSGMRRNPCHFKT